MDVRTFSEPPAARPYGRAANRGDGRLLLGAFFGELVLDEDLGPMPARVLLQVMNDLGVTNAAGRSVLGRLAEQGLLTRRHVGREVMYELTPAAAAFVRRDGLRPRSAAPFVPQEGWTILGFTVPEGRRDARHQLRSRLEMAGFRPLRDGFWIAPGRRDLRAILADLGAPGRVEAFHAAAHAITDAAALVARVWDLPLLRAAHEEFLARWEHAEPVDPLPALVDVVGDWLQLLLLDPGLPTEYLPVDWPAARSAVTVNRHRELLRPRAAAALRAMLRPEASTTVDGRLVDVRHRSA